MLNIEGAYFCFCFCVVIFVLPSPLLQNCSRGPAHIAHGKQVWAANESQSHPAIYTSRFDSPARSSPCLHLQSVGSPAGCCHGDDGVIEHMPTHIHSFISQRTSPQEFFGVTIPAQTCVFFLCKGILVESFSCLKDHFIMMKERPVASKLQSETLDAVLLFSLVDL